MKTPALFLFPLVLLGATGSSDPNTVSALARKAPAEFAADALIRLASNEKLDSRARVKWLTEAFRRAAEAQHPIKLRASITRNNVGAYLERAYQQDLDALSLRLRAVRQMLSLDSGKATKLFLSIARPAVPPFRCEDIVVADVGRYYETLGAISKIGHRDVAKMLKDRIGGITSPAQIAPVAQLLQQAELKDSDLEALTVSLAASLREISGDDRSFTYYAAATGPAILDLVGELASHHLSPLPLVEAYRLYLVHHLTGDRCADGYLINNGPPSINLASGRMSEVLGWNASVFFAEKILMPPVKPLTEQETTPHSLEGFAAGVNSCQDSQCQDINGQVRDLAFGPEGQALLASQHNDAWRARLQTTLAALEAWQPGKGQADEVFREKTAAYNSLAWMDSGASRENVLRSWLNYLKQSRATVSDRAQWFFPVNALIGRAALDPSNTKLAELLRAQDDPVIALYVQLEPLAPRGPDKILPLL
ncbi:MAG: hypothetical protein ABSE42_02830 [Bryobacteraceae bacterium]|jgi:hypothetical protein